MNDEKITRRKLSHEVIVRIRARIDSGEFSSGDQLPSERDLMDSYGVGRPAIREALQTLERDGIVDIAHGERARVVVPSADRLIGQIASGVQHLLRAQPDMLEHLKEARLFLETGTARLAAPRAKPMDIVHLRACVQAQRNALDDEREFLRCDLKFHRAIATISGNPIYPASVEALFEWATQYYRKMVHAPGAESLTLAEHSKIVDMIELGDATAAELAMRDHLTRANTLYQSLIEDR
jgi:GntR family transcriptional regulator, sialic acid-inducible nan operon repressor